MSAPARFARLGTVTVLVLATLGWAGVSGAAVPAGVTAAVGPVTCDDGDGSIALTLTAGAAPTGFEVYLDGAPYDDVVTVPATTSVTLTMTGLDDGGHTVDVVLPADPDSETDAESVISATREVACDAAPVGPYTNPKGSVQVLCGNEAVVSASNAPIGGNTADLQPVPFTLTFQPWEAGDDGGAPVDVAATVVDSFTLDAVTPTYERVLAEDEIDELTADHPVGKLRLTAGVGTSIGEALTAGECVVAANGVALPSTGA